MAHQKSKTNNAIVEETSLTDLVEAESASSSQNSRFTKFAKHRLNLILIGLLGLIVIVAAVFIPKLLTPDPAELPVQEVSLDFDPTGPYALLEPRRDGNALILNIKRVSDYQKISYELVYQSTEGEDVIDRGVTGDINGVEQGKSEYSQEILFGTCSKGDTMDPLHCVFDKGVENGTLTLKIEKPVKIGDKVRTIYKMQITWHLQQPDVALGTVVSADTHFSYSTGAVREELANVAYTIVNDLSGAPKEPDNYQFLGKVYAFNIPTAKTFPVGNVVIEQANDLPAGVKLGRYNDVSGQWELQDGQVSGSRIEASANGSGIFAVFSPK